MAETTQAPAEPTNPKLKGSNLIDCIPQTGKCPMDCPECFYNRPGAWYADIDTPILPKAGACAGKIVRINSGNDSNNDRDDVLEVADEYTDEGVACFLNTSVPRFDFPVTTSSWPWNSGDHYPVVFTCNGKWPGYLVDCPVNVMAVRIRCNTWDLSEQERLVDFYLDQGVPIVMTWMRYYQQPIPEGQGHNYMWRKHLKNSYWCPTPEAIVQTMSLFEGSGVRMCGTPWSSYCADCRNCEFLYWDCLRRMGVEV